ncbi:nicotinate-nucleotide--dimethylbenzimidazole phosphoribosyltransferase [Chitinophaga japonensis]|uniref:Nicotinate-nucleotide--dimethylbenzimidazole phosphoribosyltransferase n=1 Tax=Chitinophaga japonensis TaxID=104662 RepID=A0A562TGV5_CHIJA|nr:nicotinate-nucleotide--dimethylbenzimidazole phosphoribosyltransferase [Chitinophaga japonensis]TWI92100.1 nicotinate-nucleotide-dimethylbenzimidazole phosphoribosyltransferase [Chitinophaga japonensis]
MQISPLSRTLTAALQEKIDQKTKPPGSLGRLEAIALQAGLIQQTLEPAIVQPTIAVFAGDHGIAAEGLVNPYPQAVTAQMVYNFLQGGAAINAMCRQLQVELVIVDAGVNHSFPAHARLNDRKIGYGTRNYLHEPAMSPEQCEKAMEAGAEIVQYIHQQGCNTIGFGEMGIGNTASASLLMSCFTGLPITDCTGAGTGGTPQQVARKTVILQEALNRHGMPADAMTTLATYGGFEIAMLCGAILQAAALGMIVVIDGFIVTAALLAAHRLQPAVTDYCIFSHCSHEKGHRAMLQHLQVAPLLQLDMRLGEGTGAAMAMPVIQCATAFLQHMASFADAQVSTKNEV